MIKKLIITALLFTSSVYAETVNNTKYIEAEKMDNSNFRPFIGIEAGISYIDTTGGLDNSMLAYGLYIGMPIFSWEIIAKIKQDTTSDFNIVSSGLVLNMPIDGSGTDKTYVGLIAGNSKLEWRQHTIDSLGIKDKSETNAFYGIHIGQKYKYTRNFYARIELEYIKYSYMFSIDSKKFGADDSLKFNYGFEYKF